MVCKLHSYIESKGRLKKVADHSRLVESRFIKQENLP